MKSRVSTRLIGGWLATVALLASAGGADMPKSLSGQPSAPEVRRTGASPSATTRAPRVNRYPIRGKLKSVDLAAKTFTLSGAAKNRVFITDGDTVFTKNGKPAKLADGVPGDEVGGLAENHPGGKVLAVKVRFGPKPENEAEMKTPEASGGGQRKAASSQ